MREDVAGDPRSRPARSSCRAIAPAATRAAVSRALARSRTSRTSSRPYLATPARSAWPGRGRVTGARRAPARLAGGLGCRRAWCAASSPSRGSRSSSRSGRRASRRRARRRGSRRGRTRSPSAGRGRSRPGGGAGPRVMASMSIGRPAGMPSRITTSARPCDSPAVRKRTIDAGNCIRSFCAAPGARRAVSGAKPHGFRAGDPLAPGVGTHVRARRRSLHARGRPSWIDIATGGAVRVMRRAGGRAIGGHGVGRLCAPLARLRHPLLNPLVDYGIADARRTFEAYAVGPPVRIGPALWIAGDRARHTFSRSARHLAQRFACFTRRSRGEYSGRTMAGRTLGVTLQPRRVLTAVEEMLSDTSPAGASPLEVAGTDGSGLRTLQTQIARAARIQGYVPVCGAVLRSVPWLWPHLRQRHVCVLLEPQHGANDGAARLVSALGLESARRHVVMHFVRDAGGPRCVAVDPLGVTAMTSMIFADLEEGPAVAEVHAAARAADGSPGRFLTRLGATTSSDRRPTFSLRARIRRGVHRFGAHARAARRGAPGTVGVHRRHSRVPPGRPRPARCRRAAVAPRGPRARDARRAARRVTVRRSSSAGSCETAAAAPMPSDSSKRPMRWRRTSPIDCAAAWRLPSRGPTRPLHRSGSRASQRDHRRRNDRASGGGRSGPACARTLPLLAAALRRSRRRHAAAGKQRRSGQSPRPGGATPGSPGPAPGGGRGGESGFRPERSRGPAHGGGRRAGQGAGALRDRRSAGGRIGRAGRPRLCRRGAPAADGSQNSRGHASGHACRSPAEALRSSPGSSAALSIVCRCRRS